MIASEGRDLRFLANVDPIDVARALHVSGRRGREEEGEGPSVVRGRPLLCAANPVPYDVASAPHVTRKWWRGAVSVERFVLTARL